MDNKLSESEKDWERARALMWGFRSFVLVLCMIIMMYQAPSKSWEWALYFSFGLFWFIWFVSHYIRHRRGK
jgi:hypothetical protein